MIRPALQRTVPALKAAGIPDANLATGVEAQETAYLLQMAGAGLGFHFGWEVMGPFSTELAEALNDVSRTVVGRFSDDAVEEDVAVAAEKVRRLRELRPPEQEISEQNWLRLVACVDFLRDIGVSLDNGAVPPFVRNTYSPDLIHTAAESIDAVLGSREVPAA